MQLNFTQNKCITIDTPCPRSADAFADCQATILALPATLPAFSEQRLSLRPPFLYAHNNQLQTSSASQQHSFRPQQEKEKSSFVHSSRSFSPNAIASLCVLPFSCASSSLLRQMEFISHLTSTLLHSNPHMITSLAYSIFDAQGSGGCRKCIPIISSKHTAWYLYIM